MKSTLLRNAIEEELSAKLFDEIVNNNYLNSPDILGPKDDNLECGDY